MTYDEWIAENVKDYHEAYGMCRQVSEKMLTAFPELKLVRGHYYCAHWGEREHWWLVAPDGEIVDPTKIQFPSLGTGEYVELDPDEEEPIGMCAQCGEYSYESKGGGTTCCSTACEDAYASYLGVTIAR